MALIAWSICEQVSRACTARISSPGDPSSPGAFAAHSKSSHTPSRRTLASSIRSIGEIEDVIGISVQSLSCCPRDNGSLSFVSFPAFPLFYLSIYLSIYPSICMCILSRSYSSPYFVFRSFYLSILLFVGFSNIPLFFSFTFLFNRLFFFLSFCFSSFYSSVSLFLRLSTCLFVYTLIYRLFHSLTLLA